MKLIFKLLSVVLFSVVVLSGCKKYSEQAFDFSTSAPPYVALKTYTDKFVMQGTDLLWAAKLPLEELTLQAKNFRL